MSTQKKILLNASTNIMGGGLLVAIDYLYQLISLNSYNITLICPNIKSFSVFNNQCKVIYVPKISLFKPFRWFLDYIWLPIKIAQINPSVVLSLTNLPALTSKRQIFLHDNPYLTHQESSKIHLKFFDYIIHSSRNKLFLSRIKYVTQFVVQTNYEKRCLQNTIGRDARILVLEPFIPSHLKLFDDELKTKDFEIEAIKLICPSWYYKHKNLELFNLAAEIIRNNKYKIQFYLTLDKDQSSETRIFLNSISKYKDIIFNLGYQTPEKMQALIEKFDGIILPSLMETFGLNCIDAWVCKKPLFISDLPFARENCKGAAFYFDPKNAQNMLDSIFHAFHNKIALQQVINAGSIKLMTLSNSSHLKGILER